jgi:acyl dehydratase
VSAQRRRPRLNPAVAGKAFPATTYEVTAAAIEAYARATNTGNERYRSGPNAVAGPMWPVVPAFGFFMVAAGDPDLGGDFRRLVHLREEHVLHAPVRPRDVLIVTGVLEHVDEHAGTFTVAVSEADPEGRLMAEVRGTMLVRGAGAPAPVILDAPPSTCAHEARVRIDDDQTVRYAQASGDHNPIHLDPRAARRSGLRSIIVHGMCTMAMATAGAVDGLGGGEPCSVERVAVSFARPVLPGQELTTRYWPKLQEEGARTYGFATTNEQGEVVLTNAEVRVRA